MHCEHLNYIQFIGPGETTTMRPCCTLSAQWLKHSACCQGVDITASSTTAEILHAPLVMQAPCYRGAGKL